MAGIGLPDRDARGRALDCGGEGRIPSLRTRVR
jgi:hypothetical protein